MLNTQYTGTHSNQVATNLGALPTSQLPAHLRHGSVVIAAPGVWPARQQGLQQAPPSSNWANAMGSPPTSSLNYSQMQAAVYNNSSPYIISGTQLFGSAQGMMSNPQAQAAAFRTAGDISQVNAPASAFGFQQSQPRQQQGYILLESSPPPQVNAFYTACVTQGPGGYAVLKIDHSPNGSPLFLSPSQHVQTTPQAAGMVQTLNSVPVNITEADQQQQQQQQRRRQSHDVRQWGFAVVDQLHPFLPRVPLPPSAIAEETRGIGYYNNDVLVSSVRPCASSVCLLYAHVGCTAGKDCTSFHVDPEYLRLSRAVSQPLCCSMHNCFYSQEMISRDCAPGVIHKAYCLALDTPEMMAAGVGSDGGPRLVDVSLFHLSLTVGLESLPIRNGKAVISLRRHVCRLHLEGRCKWTKDCGHVHVCRHLLPLLEKKEVLDFLSVLLTDDTESLCSRIRRSAHVESFVHSVAVLPLLTQLIRTRCLRAVKALVESKAACLPSQLEALQKNGWAEGPWEMTMVSISPKIEPYFVP